MNPQSRIRVAAAVAMLGLVVMAFAVEKSGGTQKGQAAAGDQASFLIYESERGVQLLGAVERADILAQLPDWDQEYEPYEPDPQALELLGAVAEPVRIVCVLGTWCGDSEREVPRFWKILDLAQNPALELSLLAVGRASDAEADRLLGELGFAQNIREQYGVQFVPTFVFLQGDEELGRIVETPTVSLEQDAADLLAPSPPQPPQWK